MATPLRQSTFHTWTISGRLLTLRHYRHSEFIWDPVNNSLIKYCAFIACISILLLRQANLRGHKNLCLETVFGNNCRLLLLNIRIMKLLLLCNTHLIWTNNTLPCQFFHNHGQSSSNSSHNPHKLTRRKSPWHWQFAWLQLRRTMSRCRCCQDYPTSMEGDCGRVLDGCKEACWQNDGHQGCCIVTNTPEFNCVQYAHLLPRAATPELVSHHMMLCVLVQLQHYNITSVRTTWIFLGYGIRKLARRQPLQCHAAWVPWFYSISLRDLLEIKSMFIYTPFLTAMPGFCCLRKKL